MHAGALAEQVGCQELASLPEPGDLRCWQRVDSDAAPKVLRADACTSGLLRDAQPCPSLDMHSGQLTEERPRR